MCGGGTQGPQGPDEAAELRFKAKGRRNLGEVTRILEKVSFECSS